MLGVAAAGFLASCHLSFVLFLSAVDEYIPAGSLVEAIAGDVTEVRLECPVARVDQTGEDVRITTIAGETVRASAVVVGVPMNTWNDIEFLPELSEVKRSASAERHGTERIAKAILRVRNAPIKPAIIASPPRSAGGAQSLFTAGEFDNGDQLMGIFGYVSLEGEDPEVNFDRRDSIERALEALTPGAELVDFVSHNFATDPFSKGGMISWRPGRVTKSHSALGAPEGRLAFTTSDIAPQWLMVVEGAIESGHRAAWQTDNQLQRQHKSRTVGA
jgi:hypothetical protein